MLLKSLNDSFLCLMNKFSYFRTKFSLSTFSLSNDTMYTENESETIKNRSLARVQKNKRTTQCRRS